MKANEFIKKFGWGKAKNILSLAKYDGSLISFDLPEHNTYKISIHVSELKRLVKSHEIVESYTSRFNSDAEWFYVSEYCKKNRISPFFSENYDKASNIYKKAIADVESCQ